MKVNQPTNPPLDNFRFREDGTVFRGRTSHERRELEAPKKTAERDGEKRSLVQTAVRK